MHLRVAGARSVFWGRLFWAPAVSAMLHRSSAASYSMAAMLVFSNYWEWA